MKQLSQSSWGEAAWAKHLGCYSSSPGVSALAREIRSLVETESTLFVAEAKLAYIEKSACSRS